MIATLAAAVTIPHQTAATGMRMSVHNRLLFNRAAVSGLDRVEVLMLTDPAALDRLEGAVTNLDGRVGRSDTRTGYVRADLPIGNMLQLVSNPLVEAWHMSTGSRKAWYRDGPPLSNATMFREFETRAPPRIQPAATTERPMLPRDLAGQGGYTADDDSGLREWRKRHPSFDGRGVTIAIVESGIPDFTHPAFGAVRTLDGHETTKIAGIINAMDADQPDATRVTLDRDVRVVRSWARVGARTYIFPRPGNYRFGTFPLTAGGNLVQNFGVIEDAATDEIRVDADGDDDFRNDQPVSDVNDRLDVREFTTLPQPSMRVPFVVARGPTRRTVHVYPATGSHITMTASVAAGSLNSNSLAAGVAPNARILIVHVDTRLRDYIEAYLAAAQREDVDVINDSTGITLLPETGADFVGRFMSRIGRIYNKVILHAANNTQQLLNTASTPGDVLSIGGTIGPATLSALFGGQLDELVVHPTGGAGPGIDGSIRPDVLAPVHVISADLPSIDNGIVLPARAPQWPLPRAYQISCCTSSSTPFASGLTALLVSAAKQTGVRYSRETITHAIRVGARFLSAVPSYKQGHGVFDVNAAWLALNQTDVVPRIEVTTGVDHPIAPYAAAGDAGIGILERDGWRVGMSGRRTLHLRRTSGPERRTVYRVSWTGNDEVFTAAASVALPLDATVALPVDISARNAGVHSALLNLHDPASGSIVFRTQATIVVAHELDERTRRVTLTGTLPTMREQSHYVRIPDAVSSVTTRLRVTHGRVKVSFVSSHGVYLSYYPHLHPAMSRQFEPGTYVISLAAPVPGVWTISVMNESARREGHSSDEAARYSIDVGVQHASLQARRLDDTSFTLDMRSRAVPVREPAFSYSLGSLISRRAEFLANGLPNQFAIDVPENTGTLSVRVQSTSGRSLEIHLYDCSSGECFSYAFTIPASTTQSLRIRRPATGRWIAAVNAAPASGIPGSFVIDTMLTGTPQNGRWGERVDVGALPARVPGSDRVILFELFDAVIEREERQHPWENRPGVEKLNDWPVAIGSVIYRID